MATILKIGFQQFLVRKASDAAAVIKSLSDAVSVESRYRGGREVYWPSSRDRDGEISMRTIQETAVFSTDPGDVDVKTVEPEAARGRKLLGR